MKLRSKKGYALAYTMYFILLAAVTSVGVYNHAYYISKEAHVQKPVSLRGYYAAIAAERYAAILMKNPQANFGFDAEFNGETVTIGLPEALRQDLCLRSSEDLAITVTEYNSTSPQETPWAPNTYEVRATFRS